MKKHTLLLGLALLVFGRPAVSQDRDKAYLVSNAHFDSQWNWDVQRSILEYIPKTLNQNLHLLSQYPDYVFNFEGGIKYQWMKEYYPHQYELIKRYIREGRWHITDSTSTARSSASRVRTSSFRTASASGGRFPRSPHTRA